VLNIKNWKPYCNTNRALQWLFQFRCPWQFVFNRDVCCFGVLSFFIFPAVMIYLTAKLYVQRVRLFLKFCVGHDWPLWNPLARLWIRKIDKHGGESSCGLCTALACMGGGKIRSMFSFSSIDRPWNGRLKCHCRMYSLCKLFHSIYGFVIFINPSNHGGC
jgi:hypothetical protein